MNLKKWLDIPTITLIFINENVFRIYFPENSRKHNLVIEELSWMEVERKFRQTKGYLFFLYQIVKNLGGG